MEPLRSFDSENQAFISCLYLLASLVGLFIYPIMRKKEKRNFKLGFGVIKYALGTGVCLALYQTLYTYSMAHVDGTFLFPALTGGTIIMSTFFGIIAFKDRFTKRQMFGVILGLISLIMMNY